MAVYIDNMQIEWRGKRWCHLVADTLEELHAFAGTLGLRRDWFQTRASYPHYDVTVPMRRRALILGALEGDRVTIITCAKKLKFELAATKDISVIRPHISIKEEIHASC